MTAQVIYLHSWLDCPDDIHRRHYQMQIKLNEAKNFLFYRLEKDQIAPDNIRICYHQWIKKNREKLKLIYELID